MNKETNIARITRVINQSINQSLLFQAAWPIETQDKTRQTQVLTDNNKSKVRKTLQ